jgi:hypothetical protein
MILVANSAIIFNQKWLDHSMRASASSRKEERLSFPFGFSVPIYVTVLLAS